MASRPSRLERLVKGERTSPLELLVGPSRYADELIRNSTQWATIVVGSGTLAFALAGTQLGLNRAGLAAMIGLCVVLIGAIPLAGPGGTRLFFPLLAISAGLLCGVVVWLAGPGLGITAVLLPAYAAACFLFFNRRTATIAALLNVGGFTVVVLTSDGYPQPSARILFVAATTAATGLIIGRFLTNLEALARSERSLHAEVEAAKVRLEGRVTDQVDEIDRLGRLQRFLSPQVAATVMSQGGEDMLATHRRQIAVIFVDLRGFTAFSAVAEPEDVVEVLSEFYAAVGQIVKRLEATVGGFGGDSVMAYFNDPFPCDDPAGRALDMATSLRLPMSGLGERWSQRGFRIGYGVGIAYGYATLGTIGFEERSDYTPIGSVVNLASRLCDEAGNGEILLDGRAHEAVHTHVAAEPVKLELKGFNGTVNAYRVTRNSAQA